MIGVTSEPMTRVRWRRNRTNSRRQSDSAGRHQLGRTLAGATGSMNVELGKLVVVVVVMI
jgi:hypothetical protein